jgi:hypothetical protein
VDTYFPPGRDRRASTEALLWPIERRRPYALDNIVWGGADGSRFASAPCPWGQRHNLLAARPVHSVRPWPSCRQPHERLRVARTVRCRHLIGSPIAPITPVASIGRGSPACHPVQTAARGDRAVVVHQVCPTHPRCRPMDARVSSFHGKRSVGRDRHRAARRSQYRVSPGSDILASRNGRKCIHRGLVLRVST